MKSLDLHHIKFNVVIPKVDFCSSNVKEKSGSHGMRIKIMVKRFGSWKTTTMNMLSSSETEVMKAIRLPG